MMQRQKAFRFASQIPAIPPTSTTPERAQARLAALLRRQAADIGETVTTCPPDAITHAMARLRDIREIMQLAISHEGLLPERERQRTDRQLMHPATVADWFATLEITARMHRTPAWVNSTQAELGKINARIECIAAMICGKPGSLEAFRRVTESEVVL